MAKDKGKKKLGMTTLIFIGLFLGAFTGIILYYFVPSGYVRDTVLVDGIFYVVGQGFLRLMQMLVVPLVFCSLICGSAAIGDTKTLGKVGVKTIVFYLFTTALAISIALAVGTIVKPGLGLDTAAIQTQDFVEYYSNQPDWSPGKRYNASGYCICPFCRYYTCKTR